LWSIFLRRQSEMAIYFFCATVKKNMAFSMGRLRRMPCAYRLAMPQPLKARLLQHPLLMHSASCRTQKVEPQLGWPPKLTQATAQFLRIVEQLIPLPPGAACPPSRRSEGAAAALSLRFAARFGSGCLRSDSPLGADTFEKS
jgi:hypothetical protein